MTHIKKSVRMRTLWLAITVSVFSALAYSSGSSFSNQYDAEFDFYGTKYLAPEGYAWRRLKAQCAAESGKRLDRFARSPAGARGVCQFMPATWSEVSRTIGRIGASPFSPRANIHAAAYYDRRLSRMWRLDRSAEERWKLVVASYNAGPGSIIRAQTISGGERLWAGIAPHLQSITGGNARETLTYVQRIESYYIALTEEDRANGLTQPIIHHCTPGALTLDHRRAAGCPGGLWRHVLVTGLSLGHQYLPGGKRPELEKCGA